MVGVVLGPRPLARPELVHRVLDAPPGGVVTVTAPAGHGKSTLLDAVAARLGSAAVQLAAHPGPPPLADRIADAVGAHGTSAAAITRALDATARTLVLDDLQRLREPDEPDLLARVAAGLRIGRLVLASRREPPIGRVALKIRGQLVEITGGDLRFDQEEVREVLRTRGLDLPAPDVQRVIDATGGWPAGVAAAAGASRAARAPPLGELRTHVAGVVEREVLDGLDASLRRALLEAAVVGTFDAGVLGAVTGRARPEDAVRRLREHHLFLEPSPEISGWWTVYPPTRELLVGIARRELGEDPARRLRLDTLVEWSRRGRGDLAIQALVDGDDPIELVRVLAAAASNPEWTPLAYAIWHPELGRSAAEVLGRADPAAYAHDLPELAAAISVAVAAGDLDLARRLRSTSDALLAGGAPEPPLLAVLDAHLAAFTGELARAGAAVTRARRRLATELEVHPLLDYHVHGADAIRALVAGEDERAADEAAAAIATRTRRHWTYDVELRSLAGVLALRRGDVAEATRRLSEADASRPSNVAFAYSLHPWLRIELLLRAGDLQRARAVAHAALSHPMYAARSTVEVVVLLVAAGLERRLGNDREADAHLARAAPVVAAAAGAAGLERLVVDAGGRVAAPADPARHVLTPREQDVLQLLRSRLTLEEIAQRLSVSVNTVKSQTRSIYRKLGVSSRAEAVDLVDGAGGS